ncbi:MAG: hypothetical protein JKY94_10000 [Rhodobacteraceae bacterium]|nr:hypothetical protein [Paracoccaceae bacterium]
MERRAFIAGAVALPAFAGTGQATPSDDTLLFKLSKKWHELMVEEKAWEQKAEAAFQQAKIEGADPDRAWVQIEDTHIDPLYSARWEIEKEMIATPAKTYEGVAEKFRTFFCPDDGMDLKQAISIKEDFECLQRRSNEVGY